MTTQSSADRKDGRPHVVIIGGGFGGLAAARALRTAPVRVTLLDRANHHLFQPLLYQVATATLPPSDITAPIRYLLRSQPNTRVLLGEVTGVDMQRKVIQTASAAGTDEIDYDFLIVAAGARHSYFGHDGWEKLAPGLKSLEDALEIRSRFLLAFEKAEWLEDSAARQKLQTFVIVGGGPTGVELAGILPEIARKAMRRDFRRLDPAATRVILLEAGPRILPSFSDATSQQAARDLAELGVEVRTNTAVTDIGEGVVLIDGGRMEAGTVFWAAGNKGSELALSLQAPLDRQGRVKVERDLTVPGYPNVFVVGDLALVMQDGAPVPGVAQAALQQGRSAGKNIQRTLRREDRVPFRYSDRGNAATLGRNKAVVEMGSLRLTGRPAWWFWLFLHILYLTGFRNRVSVLIEWAFAYFSHERGARLITRE